MFVQVTVQYSEEHTVNVILRCYLSQKVIRLLVKSRAGFGELKFQYTTKSRTTKWGLIKNEYKRGDDNDGQWSKDSLFQRGYLFFYFF